MIMLTATIESITAAILNNLLVFIISPTFIDIVMRNLTDVIDVIVLIFVKYLSLYIKRPIIDSKVIPQCTILHPVFLLYYDILFCIYIIPLKIPVQRLFSSFVIFYTCICWTDYLSAFINGYIFEFWIF